MWTQHLNYYSIWPRLTPKDQTSVVVVVELLAVEQLEELAALWRWARRLPWARKRLAVEPWEEHQLALDRIDERSALVGNRTAVLLEL